MAGPSTIANDIARTKLYLGSAEQGTVFGREFSFYSGAPTTPVSFTGNQILGAASDGPGANIIDGIGPVLDATVCSEPTLTVVSVVLGDPIVITVAFEGIQPGDVFVLFNLSGDSYGPSSITPTFGGLELTFPDESLLPAGTYSLKVIRDNNLECFDVESNIYTITGTVCAISITDLTSPTGFPVIPPGPPGFPGGSFTVDLVGAGFLSGPLTVTIGPNFFPPNDTIIPDSVTVIDDNNMSIDFTGNFNSGIYGVTVALTADPTCFAQIGYGFVQPYIALQFF
jgi:hypothetical protein